MRSWDCTLASNDSPAGRNAPTRPPGGVRTQVVLFAVPGAFTPTCSKDHVPGFIKAAADLKAKGVDTIACVSVNDAFVMKAWGDALGVGNEVLMVCSCRACLHPMLHATSQPPAQPFQLLTARAWLAAAPPSWPTATASSPRRWAWCWTAPALASAAAASATPPSSRTAW